MTLAIVACPEAVMIRDLITSAGEHTAVCQPVILETGRVCSGSRSSLGR
jgi:hypothetical protein